MSGNLRLDISNYHKADSNTDLQCIPSKIEMNGSANVHCYFDEIVKNLNPNKDKSDVIGVFRGHPLRGQEISIPSKYKGIVMTEPRPTLTEEEDRQFTISKTFDKFMYWNWDTKPTNQDKIHKAIDWANIAADLHSPLSEEDFQSTDTESK